MKISSLIVLKFIHHLYMFLKVCSPWVPLHSQGTGGGAVWPTAVEVYSASASSGDLK